MLSSRRSEGVYRRPEGLRGEIVAAAVAGLGGGCTIRKTAL